MKSSKLLTKIRKVNAFKLIMPVVIVLLIILLSVEASLFEGIFPTDMGNDQKLDSHYADGRRYVKVTIGTLYYSGYDYMQGSSIKGHYFYSLNDGQCRIYLIDKFSGEIPNVIYNYTVTGKLIFQPDSYEELLTLMARDMGWTYEGISSVSTNVILSEANFYKTLLISMGILLFLAFSFVSASIVILIFNIIRPDYAYTFSSLGHHRERRKNILRAAAEFERGPIFTSDTLYITSRYFIYLSSFNAAIIPLKDILWAYKHSTYYNVLIITWLSYTVRIITRNNRKYKLRGNDKDTVDAFLETLQELDLDIMLGYTPENIAAVKSYGISGQNIAQ